MSEKNFPIQAEFLPAGKKLAATEIPWWLAEIAYERYVELYGNQQSLERLAERGGFGRKELLVLLRKEKF